MVLRTLKTYLKTTLLNGLVYTESSIISLFDNQNVFSYPKF